MPISTAAGTSSRCPASDTKAPPCWSTFARRCNCCSVSSTQKPPSWLVTSQKASAENAFKIFNGDLRAWSPQHYCKNDRCHHTLQSVVNEAYFHFEQITFASGTPELELKMLAHVDARQWHGRCNESKGLRAVPSRVLRDRRRQQRAGSLHRLPARTKG